MMQKLAQKNGQAYDLLEQNSSHKDDIISCQAKFTELVRDYDLTDLVTTYTSLKREAQVQSIRTVNRYDCSMESLQRQSNGEVNRQVVAGFNSGI